MSESRPEESPQNEQGDAQVLGDAATEPVERNGTAPDTSEEGNVGVTEETSNGEQATTDTSVVKEDMAEETQSTATVAAVTENSSSTVEDKPAPTQEEEFVVVHLTDGQHQAESQGTDQAMSCVDRSSKRKCRSHNWRSGGTSKSPCNICFSSKRKKRHNVKYRQLDPGPSRTTNHVKYVFRRAGTRNDPEQQGGKAKGTTERCDRESIGYRPSHFPC
jgi:hypothetical protein